MPFKKVPFIAYLLVLVYLFIYGLTSFSDQGFAFIYFPFTIILAALLFRNTEEALFLIVILTPVSQDIRGAFLSFALTLPGEPFLIILTGLFILKFLIKPEADRRIIYHPLSISIIFYLSWLLISSFFSSIIPVSLKFVASKLWYIIPFFYFGSYIFRSKENIHKFIFYFNLGLLGIIVYVCARHLHYGLSENAAHWVSTPFFNDHTQYAAVLAMFLPVSVCMLFIRELESKKKNFYLFVSLALFLAILFSFTRAAWLSVVAAMGMFALIYFRVRILVILLILLPAVMLLFSQKENIQKEMKLIARDYDSDFIKHLASVGDVKTDASNMERINRWHSAIRMFQERPVTGFGPGTYAFIYGPFQVQSEKTVISTNHGNAGNAHSEYLGPLSESGLPGMLSVLFVILTATLTAFRIFRQKNGEIRLIAIGIYLGLFTYWIHGIMNNFLDTDKASVPYWSFLAILMVIDLRSEFTTANQEGDIIHKGS